MSSKKVNLCSFFSVIVALPYGIWCSKKSLQELFNATTNKKPTETNARCQHSPIQFLPPIAYCAITLYQVSCDRRAPGSIPQVSVAENLLESFCRSSRELRSVKHRAHKSPAVAAICEALNIKAAITLLVWSQHRFLQRGC